VKQQNFSKGKIGEDIARSFLLRKGYTLLEQNFNTRFGELDLIMVKDNVLVFVEVKLKVGEDFGTPEEMITRQKLTQVQNTAVAFLQQNPDIGKRFLSYQIDGVCIVVDSNNEILRINHYENLSF
jgi:putative endonuclease